jgi:hypothetical protein
MDRRRALALDHNEHESGKFALDMIRYLPIVYIYFFLGCPFDGLWWHLYVTSYDVCYPTDPLIYSCEWHIFLRDLGTIMLHLVSSMVH